MSVVVAIETSTKTGSVAIGRGPEVLGEVTIGVHNRHARAVLPALDFLLSLTDTPRRRITSVVVGAGPGSFTGVRIAASAARGLAHGLGASLYAFSSLEALAWDALTYTAGPVCSLFDARRGEVYAACYEAVDAGDALTTLLAPSAMRAADIPSALASITQRAVTFVGDGAQRYAADLGPTDRVRAGNPRASALLGLVTADTERGRVAQPSGWEPTYVRSSGAERAGERPQ